jgi:hypothetical protein
MSFFLRWDLLGCERRARRGQTHREDHRAVREMRPERLELPTLGSEDRCSVQLSYGRQLYLQLFTATGTRADWVLGPIWDRICSIASTTFGLALVGRVRIARIVVWMSACPITAAIEVGGLHHRYELRAA